MDVFLEQDPDLSQPSVVARISVSVPLRACSTDGLIAEAEQLHRRGICYVSIRRQQVLWIGEHALHDILADAGIMVSCLGFAGGFTGSLGYSYLDAVDDARRAMDLAAELRARFLVVVPGEQGLHTYKHAERTVRLGLTDVLTYASQRRIQLLVPTDSVLGNSRDSFRTRECPLNWVEAIGSPMIRPLIVVRGRTMACRLPRGWRESLATGACLRICHRCDQYEDMTNLLTGILRYLARNGGFSGFEQLGEQ